MGKKYKLTYQVPFYESDINHQIKLPHLLSFALQVSSLQSESLGNTDDWILDNFNLVWVITDYELDIKQLPRYAETIEVETEAVAYNKLFCYRKFYIYGQDGQQIIEISSTFVLMDYDTRKVVTVKDEIVAPYESEKIKKLLRAPKYKALEEAEEALFHVHYLDLDMNGHVNNSKYLEWMYEAMDIEFLKTHVPKKIHLKYLKEIHYGKDIVTRIKQDGLISQHEIKIDQGLHAQAQIEWREREEE
ncbi:acyl-ACP thioesterase domain-containing protein [Streptococcus sobrinus]|uniref:acyl-ACP thioesterase domain-containing protein n=1 Tax=Streptococcus sobrinus TaxID=1310 RepID=UPI000D706FB7|nr:acyl-ACP thioesterase domain-containing protein [Streptococcus sobrinus]AWN61371.1 acyl-[acyl-carrier-protein] thioesterase [Streptococcus sobrinus]AWN63244.1 acyl-[acyl-carrier-protein] thioesterase [Streptococcus sobrinus]SQG19604.1 oleoyl-acyl carrier protein thioesterase [Streptococcus sobrinus]